MLMMNVWSVALCFITMAIISFTHYVYRWRNPKCNGILPPGSMGFPLIGESIQFFIPSKSLDMPFFIKKRIARYGKLFRTSLAGRRIIISSDPEFNFFIFQQEGKLVQLSYLDSFAKILGQNAKNTSTGYIHKYIRNSVLNQVGIECLKEKLLSRMEVIANQYIQSWSTQPSVELKDSIASMVIDLTAKELFNYDCSKSSENVSEMFTNLMQGLMTFPVNIPGTAFHRCMKNKKKALKLLKDVLYERLNLPAETQHYGDFLDQLADDMKKEDFMNEEFAISFMFGVLFASFETISSSLAVAMVLLSDNPLVVKELTEEQEAILKNRENKDSPLTWKEYKSMTFTSQVINEILRISSVAPGIFRKVLKDIHINGYVIPEGWTIMVVPSALHMNPDKFQDPLTFNPWRWKNLGSNTAAKSFIPFGGGMRNCAGAEFSRLLMSVFLHVLVTKFRWVKIKGGNTARIPALSFRDGFHVKISEIKANTP